MANKKRFDPRKFIDREIEQEFFEKLLRFEDNARILSIRDKGGMGKSQLLQKLSYRCRTVNPRTPVSLVTFDESAINSSLTLIRSIANDLTSGFHLEFPNFKTYSTARAAGKFAPFQSSIYLQDANFQGAQGTIIASQYFQHVNNVSISEDGTLTLEQQAIADEVCVLAFLDDLKTISAEQPVVLMMDVYEKCHDELQEWIMQYFLGRYFFDLERRPEKLALVLAGREIPDFEYNWPLEDCKMIVESVKKLGTWERRHVEECLRVHGFIFGEEDLDFFWAMIQRGLTPSLVIQSMEQILRRQ